MTIPLIKYTPPDDRGAFLKGLAHALTDTIYTMHYNTDRLQMQYILFLIATRTGGFI